MPRFAANLTTLFTELDFADRFAAAADAGFEAVEILFPYEHPADQVAEQLTSHGLELALINLPPGEQHERGLAGIPGREDAFWASMETGLDYAERTGCQTLHVMAGLVELDDRVLDTYLGNLRRAADLARERGRTFTIEPLSPRAMPGYLLDSVTLARLVLAELRHPNVRLQLDLFHAQQTDGDLTVLIAELGADLGHVQIAAVPDRHEPDHGEIDYRWLLARIDESGYQGWVGCEYHPAAGTTAGLGWLAAYRD